MFPEFTSPRGFKNEILASESTAKARIASAVELPLTLPSSDFKLPFVREDGTSVLDGLVLTRSAHDFGTGFVAGVGSSPDFDVSGGDECCNVSGEDESGVRTTVSELCVLLGEGLCSASLSSGDSFALGDGVAEDFLLEGTAILGVAGMIGTAGFVPVRVCNGAWRTIEVGVVGCSDPTSDGA